MKKLIALILAAICVFGLAGCGKDTKESIPSASSAVSDGDDSTARREDIPPYLPLNQEMLQYQEMTYQLFQEQAETEAEFYHANFYFVPLPATEINAVFHASEYDEALAMAVLAEDDKIIRLEGELEKFLPEMKEEVSVSEFAKGLAWDSNVPDFIIEEGAGTAYYVADQYVQIWIDDDGDSEDDYLLQISLEQSDLITPDSYTWLSWENDR